VFLEARGLSRLQHPYASHNICNPSSCLVGWVLSPRSGGPIHPGTAARSSFLSPFARRRITESCVKGCPFAREVASFLGSEWKSSLAGVAPARALGSAPRLRSCLTPACHQQRAEQEHASGKRFVDCGSHWLACAAFGIASSSAVLVATLLRDHWTPRLLGGFWSLSVLRAKPIGLIGLAKNGIVKNLQARTT